MAKTSIKNEEVGTEIAEKASTEINNYVVLDFEADSGMGLENADKTSFAIPFISMLQGLSPQIETVDGAKPGLFINSVTNELFGEILVVPCAFQRRFVRWAPRSTGGGYKGEYSPIEVETGTLQGMKEFNGVYMMDVPEGAAPFDPKGLPLYDHLSDARNHYVMFKNAAGSWQPAIMAFSSTQIKKSKRWMSRINGIEMRNGQGKAFTPPSFSHIYKAKPIKEENAKGSWWGIEIDLVGPVSDAELYSRAKDFNKQVNEGAVEVAPPPAPEGVGSTFDNDKF